MPRDPVLDGAFDAIITIDTCGKVVDVNAAAERMFGYSRDECCGRELAGLVIPEERRGEHRRALSRQPHDGPSRIIGQRLETEAVRADNTRFPIELSVSRIESSNGVRFTAWIRDLTERRRAEEALRTGEAHLRQSMKMIAVGRLAGGVAHDVNNALTTIFGYADLLLDEFPAEDRRRLDVEEIKRAAHRAATLTRELLAFSQQQVMQPQRIDLNAVAEHLRPLLRERLGGGISLCIERDPSLGMVWADPDRIEQAVMNLTSNSHDAMPDGGRLTIATANEDLDPAAAARLNGMVPGRFVRLMVSDTGEGIPDSARAHIFEPFFTTKELGKGSGLGLATVYGIVKQSGGWIYLDETPGSGASFRIYLPRID